MSSSGARVRAMYRETLKRARALGGERGDGVRLDARDFYRKVAGTDEAHLKAMLSEAESRLSFLRMVTPRYNFSNNTRIAYGTTYQNATLAGMLVGKSG